MQLTTKLFDCLRFVLSTTVETPIIIPGLAHKYFRMVSRGGASRISFTGGGCFDPVNYILLAQDEPLDIQHTSMMARDAAGTHFWALGENVNSVLEILTAE